MPKQQGGGIQIKLGGIWFIAWLFTIGYCGLSWWQMVAALLLWPYYLGKACGP